MAPPWRSSEGYGEATCATAERLVQLLSRLTHLVPAMDGWDGVWNLDADATFLDIGSGYGKVRVFAKRGRAQQPPRAGSTRF